MVVTRPPSSADRAAFASPVPPGTGWPEDPATPDTPVATTPTTYAASPRTALGELDARVSVCSACPRLVAWREDVAHTKRASFADQPYWGRPIAGWGDPEAGGAHRRARPRGQRRQPHRPGVHRRLLRRLAVRHPAPGRAGGPGRQRARGRRAAAGRRADGRHRALRAAANRPTTEERDTCGPGSARRSRCWRRTCGWSSRWGLRLGRRTRRPGRVPGTSYPRPRPKFGHGAEVDARRPAVGA